MRAESAGWPNSAQGAGAAHQASWAGSEEGLAGHGERWARGAGQRERTGEGLVSLAQEAARNITSAPARAGEARGGHGAALASRSGEGTAGSDVP